MPRIKMKRYDGSNLVDIHPETDWAYILNRPNTFTPSAHDHDISEINGEINADKLNGKTDSQFVIENDLLMNTNPFGGKKLYISALDNAFHSFDRRYHVVVTVHNVTHNNETYPKLNPDWVAEYDYTENGGIYTITNSVNMPVSVLVYDGTTYKTDYIYNQSTGTIALNFTPSGEISIFPDYQTQKYLDSPIVSTKSDVHDLFDGSYESGISVAFGQYIRIRMSPDETMHTKFSGYPYGSIFASFYYTGTPEKVEYRGFNVHYFNHGIGWQESSFSDYTGSKTTSNYIAKTNPPAQYGRTIMDIIVYGHDTSGGAYGTSITQLDWKKDRPNLSLDGATVTKYGSQTIYDKLTLKSYLELYDKLIYHGDFILNNGSSDFFKITASDIMFTDKKVFHEGNMRFIGQSEYDALVTAGTTDPNVYYNIYDDSV